MNSWCGTDVALSALLHKLRDMINHVQPQFASITNSSSGQLRPSIILQRKGRPLDSLHRYQRPLLVSQRWGTTTATLDRGGASARPEFSEASLVSKVFSLSGSAAWRLKALEALGKAGSLVQRGFLIHDGFAAIDYINALNSSGAI